MYTCLIHTEDKLCEVYGIHLILPQPLPQVRVANQVLEHQHQLPKLLSASTTWYQHYLVPTLLSASTT